MEVAVTLSPDVMAFEQLKALERVLHTHQIRRTPAELERLIHQDFLEIGYDGKTYTYKDITEYLLNEEDPAFEIWSQDYEYQKISNVTYLLTYNEARFSDGCDTLYRHSKRASIWQNNKGQWQIIFHQATPADAFNKAT